MAFFDDFVQKVNKAAQTVSTKTKDNMEYSRLSSASKNLNNELDRLCTQIGRTYVDSDGQAIDELKALSEGARELMAQLEELERRKLQVRNQNRCPNCGSVMTLDMRFCSNCGTKMPEPPAPEPEPEPEPTPEIDANPTFDAETEPAPAIDAEPDFDSIPTMDFQAPEFDVDPDSAPVIGADDPDTDA